MKIKLNPDISRVASFNKYLKEFYNSILELGFKREALQAVKNLGIQSRVTFKSILMGRRKFPLTKLSLATQALDLSHSETLYLENILSNRVDFDKKTENKEIEPFQLGTQEILSTPLNTIILNLCDLKKKYTRIQIVENLKHVFDLKEIEVAIEFLMSQKQIEFAYDNTLSRVSHNQRYFIPQGIKFDFAKNYLLKSMDLAKQNYDLPLNQREYTAFTTKIKSSDFAKLKDLVREFRKNVYALSNVGEDDTVIHVNLNTFVVSNFNADSSL